MKQFALKTKVRRFIKAYKLVFSIIFECQPSLIVLTILSSFFVGFLGVGSVSYFNDLLSNAFSIIESGSDFSACIPPLVMFTFTIVMKPLLENVLIYGYIMQRSRLIIRAYFTKELNSKLARIKYESFEDESAYMVIDKAYTRAQDAVCQMFPQYVAWSISAMITSVGLLVMFGQVTWWLPITILLPFIIRISAKGHAGANLYNELEKYWKDEKQYEMLSEMLISRNLCKEKKLFDSTRYLVNEYTKRIHARNKQYEKYYFGKHFIMQTKSEGIQRLGILANLVILLLLYSSGQISLSLLIALSGSLMGNLYNSLFGACMIFVASFYPMNSLDYFYQFMDMEEECNTENAQLDNYAIEFKNVWFRYPGTNRDILCGVSFMIRDGESISLVGANGEGKSTIIKLLLRLFCPDKGTILIGGMSIERLSRSELAKIFGVVFQDFGRFSFSFYDNVRVGFPCATKEQMEEALRKVDLTKTVLEFEDGAETLLGKDFTGSADVSGGQWQRIALARSLVGDKKILLLDEPSSQLDPMAEAYMYENYAKMIEGRTSILISHRMSSTRITDRILVIDQGKIAESGAHHELIGRNGIYSRMFNEQKKWYENDLRKEGAV